MSLEVVTEKDADYTATVKPEEVTEDTTTTICVLPSKEGVDNVHNNDGGLSQSGCIKSSDFNEIQTNSIAIAPSMVENCHTDHQNIVAIDGNSLVNFAPDSSIVNNLQVVTAENDSNSNSSGTIYLFVSSTDLPTTVLQPIAQQQDQDASSPSTTQTLGTMSNSVSTDVGSLKTPSDSPPGTIVQVLNTDGVPVNLNVNELLATIQNSNKVNSLKKDPILSLSTSIISTTTNNPENIPAQNKNNASSSGQYLLNSSENSDQIATVPNWALHLKDCTLCGDTYTGYVTTEIEMDAVLNLYKKETQSLFAIRQTPSPAKDESVDTVRLMWKSQYVPYDGIPFANVGRRATVMECEHGPRKRSNAMKRMAQIHGQKHNLKKVPNLTCPARLFVKKVRKFPQYRVPLNADPKVVRSMQEHALKMVRSNGIHTGEIRLYMQLPLPTSHRYHHIGNSVEAFQKELDNLDEVLLQSISVDGRVMNDLQTLVRQGYTNPFLVRAALKDFVDNKMELNMNETKPQKHNKTFYPTLIEIQNMIQQTEAAIDAGILTKLPPPDVPPVQPRPKRKRTQTVDEPHSPSIPSPSSLVIKRMKIDVPEGESDILENGLKDADTKKKENDLTSSDQNETIALTLTDSQLENFSVTNFTYDQLAQLAKIGLIALNNAAKDGDNVTDDTQGKTNLTEKVIIEPASFSTSDGESILIVTPNNAEEEKARLRLLTGMTENVSSPTTLEPDVVSANIIEET